MEERKLKVNFNKSGRGSYTPRLTLPITDLRKMGITPENRQVNYYYNEENDIMIISKKDLNNIKIITK
jgi:hypothetical protein